MIYPKGNCSAALAIQSRKKGKNQEIQISVKVQVQNINEHTSIHKIQNTHMPKKRLMEGIIGCLYIMLTLVKLYINIYMKSG